MKSNLEVKFYYLWLLFGEVSASRISSVPLNSSERKPVYRVITTLTPAFINLRVTRPGEPPFVRNDQYEGYLKDLIDKLSEILGFDYEIDHVKLENNASGRNPIIPEDYNGMIGKIVYNEADMAVADLTITTKRLKLVHFSYPFYISGYGILAYRSNVEDWKVQIWNFLNPFQFETWLYIIVASILLYLIRAFNYALTRSKFQKYKQNANLPKSCFRILHQLYQLATEDENYHYESVSGKILTYTWKIFRFIIISCYAANLAAFMTVSRINHPISSVNDLVYQNTIEYAAKSNTAIMGFLKHSTVPVYQKMYQYLTKNNLMGDIIRMEEIVEHVRSKKGKLVHISDRIDIDFASSRAPCDVVGVGETFDLRGLGIAMNPHFPFEFKRDVDVAILALLETGWFDSLEQKWWHSRNECKSPKDQLNKSNEGLTVTKLGGVFLILFTGIIIAGIISAVEYFQNNSDGRVEDEKMQHDTLKCQNCRIAPIKIGLESVQKVRIG